MLKSKFSAFMASCALLAAAVQLSITPTAAVAQAANQEIIITILRVKALEKLDNFSKADFLARISIDGESLSSNKIRQQDEIRPNWVIAKRVPAGEVRP